jgi:hypothetical protein
LAKRGFQIARHHVPRSFFHEGGAEGRIILHVLYDGLPKTACQCHLAVLFFTTAAAALVPLPF